MILLSIITSQWILSKVYLYSLGSLLKRCQLVSTLKPQSSLRCINVDKAIEWNSPQTMIINLFDSNKVPRKKSNI